VLTVKKAFAGGEWKKDPALGEGREFKMQLSVNRVGSAFTDEFSEVRDSSFRE